MKTILFATLMLAASAAHAGSETWINFGFASHHASGTYNEANDGIGAEMRVSDRLSVIAGEYRNSVHTDSRYAAGIVTLKQAGPVKLAAVVGAVDGYQGINGGNAVPMVLPAASYESGLFGVNALVIPPMGDVAPAVVAVQIKLRLQ